MAELKGPILFTGSIGNLRAYYDKVRKRYYLSTKGGTNKDIINSNTNLARQRENMNEFKGCSKWGSQLTRSLDDISHLREGYFFSDFVAMGKLIQKQHDQGLRGFRSIESSKFSKLLLSLNFNRVHPFDQVFSQQYELSLSGDKKTVTLQLMNFKSFSRISWPDRYSTFRIALVIAQQPDYAWNPKDKQYQPFIPELLETSVVTYSDWRYPITDSEDLILSASFAKPALQLPGSMVVVAIGLEVSAYGLNTGLVNFTGTGSMKIAECYV
jgi:hypothetical protein